MSKPRRLAEVDSPLVIGRSYLVPSIKVNPIHATKGRYCGFGLGWIPIWPILHDDKDIGFPDEHYHVDWRFMSEAAIRQVVIQARSPEYARGALHPADFEKLVQTTGIETIMETCILYVLTKESICAGPKERPQRCHRNQLTWPSAHKAPERLEPLFKGAKLKCGRCPHWGFDLRGIAPSVNGVIQCPGHGLCFRADTGDLVPRKEVEHALHSRTVDAAPDVGLQGKGRSKS
jgi:hypothetical protein